MAKFLAISLSLCVLVLSGCFALRDQPQQNECQLENLDALRPDNRIESEAGMIETWNPNNRQFRCAGVALSRCTLQCNALRRPSYSNAPQEIYIQQGNGLFGMIFPGCPETFEESRESQQGEGRGFRDSHQKVERFREGDVIAVPTGVVFWMFNDQETEVIAVSLMDTSSAQNQLDQMPRRFYLSGKQEQEFLQYQQQHQKRQGRRGEREEEKEGGNIFNGFNREFLQEVLNVDRHVVSRLQGENEDEEKGAIIRVKGGLSTVTPPERQSHGRHQEEEGDERQPRHHHRQEEEEEDDERQPRPHRGRREEEEEEEDEDERRPHHSRGERRRQRDNGIEETICTARLRQNIGASSSPDIYNPRAGRITTVTSLDLPVLRWLKLSAEHGSLHRDAMFVPHINKNANSLIYALRGRARLQVVNCNGNTVFDGELEAGRALIVPQNFAVAAKSMSDRFSYVSFKTHDRAMINRLVGGGSSLSGMPEEVIAATFNLERNEARQVKNNMPFKFLVPPRESQNKAAA